VDLQFSFEQMLLNSGTRGFLDVTGNGGSASMFPFVKLAMAVVA